MPLKAKLKLLCFTETIKFSTDEKRCSSCNYCSCHSLLAVNRDIRIEDYTDTSSNSSTAIPNLNFRKLSTGCAALIPNRAVPYLPFKRCAPWAETSQTSKFVHAIPIFFFWNGRNNGFFLFFFLVFLVFGKILNSEVFPFFKFLPEEYGRRQAHDFLKFSFSAKHSPNSVFFTIFQDVRVCHFFLFTLCSSVRVERQCGQDTAGQSE